MKALIFLKDLKGTEIELLKLRDPKWLDDEKYQEPLQLEVKVLEAFRSSHDKILFDALLVNNSSREFLLLVSPVGAAPAPFGGPSPFYISISSGALNEKIKYVGKLYPPAPPTPMEIKIPGNATVKFTAAIDLKDYEYKGSPELTLDWSFVYYKGGHPKGTLKVKLPKRSLH